MKKFFQISVFITLLASLLVPVRLCAQSSLTGDIEQFSRGIEQSSFVPKGQWITGVSVSYSQSNQDNYQFLVVEDLSGDSYQFKVSPMLFYAFKDNMALGGRFAYSRQRTQLDKGMVKIDSETSWDVDNLFSISQTYAATAAFRNYISFGDNTRFGMFYEAQLELVEADSLNSAMAWVKTSRAHTLRIFLST